MTKTKQQSSAIQLVDIGSFILSLWFVYSVIQNARDLIEQNIKNAPASYVLILTLILIGSSLYRRKKLSVLNVITLSVISTAVVIWLLGLSTIG